MPKKPPAVPFALCTDDDLAATLEFEAAFRAYAARVGEERARAFAEFLGRKPTEEQNNDFVSLMLRDMYRESGMDNMDRFIRERLLPDPDSVSVEKYDRMFKAYQKRLNNAEKNPALDDIRVAHHPDRTLLVFHPPKPGRTGRPPKNPKAPD
jgi:hypothetical protein